jgi:hypothetical protein
MAPGVGVSLVLRALAPIAMTIELVALAIAIGFLKDAFETRSH